jgi:hypothetical protein
MIYVVHFFTLLLVLVLDIGLVTTLDEHIVYWDLNGATGYIIKMTLAPLFLLTMGIQQISNKLLGTKFEL